MCVCDPTAYGNTNTFWQLNVCYEFIIKQEEMESRLRTFRYIYQSHDDYFKSNVEMCTDTSLTSGQFLYTLYAKRREKKTAYLKIDTNNMDQNTWNVWLWLEWDGFSSISDCYTSMICSILINHSPLVCNSTSFFFALSLYICICNWVQQSMWYETFFFWNKCENIFLQSAVLLPT